MKDIVKVGVVGCGYWGPNLLRNFMSLTNAAVTTICDVNQKRLQHLLGLYPGVGITTRYESMLEGNDVDAVIVATPVSLHYPQAKAALLAGKHVFIEKPMAASSRECRDLIRLAEEKGLTLMIGHTFLYSAAIWKIKAIIDSGDLGQIRYICARRLNLGLFQRDINVVWDLAPHDLSIITHLAGESPVAVSCQGNSCVRQGIEDVASTTLHFPSGVFAIIQSSWLDPKKVREMAIVGKHRMVLYDDLEPHQKIKVYDQRVETPPHNDTFAEFQYSYHYGDMYAPYIKQEEPLKVESQHFVECVQTGKKPLTDGRQGLELVKIIEAAMQSLANKGARVDVVAEPETAALEARKEEEYVT
jgi:predicted dehydrogenase